MSETAPSGTRLKCHRCGSPELVLREVRHEHVEWQDGLYLTEQGAIKAQGEAVFNPGEVQPHLTEIECEGCGHAWRPRRTFTGSRQD